MMVFEGKSGKKHYGDAEITSNEVLKPHSLLFPDGYYDFGEEDSFWLIVRGHIISMNLNLLLALSEVKTIRDGILCVFPDHLLPILQFSRIISVWMRLKVPMMGVRYKLICSKVPDPAQGIPPEIPYYYPLYSHESGGLVRQNVLMRLHRLYIIAPIGFSPSIVNSGYFGSGSDFDSDFELESKANGGVYYVPREAEDAVRKSIGHRLPVELVDMILGYIPIKTWTLYTYKLRRCGTGNIIELSLRPGPAQMHTLHQNSFESWIGGGKLRYAS